MYRPPHYQSDTLQSRAELEALLAKGPVYLFSETPTIPGRVLPKGAHANLLYSEFPFAANPRLASWSTRLVCDFAELRRKTPLKPPRLAWMTLFRVQRGGSSNAEISPCVPAWNAPLE
jgi:phosphatidylinositol glycan class B